MPRQLEPGEHALSIRVDDRERDYLLYVPHRHGHAAGLPLVLFFHGGGGSARLSVLTTGWSDKAEEHGFYVVYPEAVRPDVERSPTFLRNPQFWNVGSGVGQGELEDVDDVGFVRTLLDHLSDRLRIDSRRVYASGFSNGAALVFRVAMEASERFAAVGPVSGYPWREGPRPEHPPSVIYITGTADPMNPIDGSVIDSPWGALRQHPPVEQAVSKWADWLGCPPEPRTLQDKDGVKRLRFGPGEQGVDFDYCTIEGAGHAWPGGPQVLAERIGGKPTDKLNATDVIWEFFEQHPRA
jgi:polyhydroxybutyrate depolymerase